ncbi:hypothetical protein H7347_01410 [Corynebacterium sp. zg-331]|uniref:hypothetical protein n=1 Tax=unclassified Corynebacterium TaxID=2624378 RepID=UPI00128AF944|nr:MULTISPECIES: hypothetical protein [unclassified Corynebacterium]MBC3185245.1 hypothetical protein [Corynebacterium sp. zg-331]MPV51743.1 hypothetical protein [Corynebacterium sp. zg331]
MRVPGFPSAPSRPRFSASQRGRTLLCALSACVLMLGACSAEENTPTVEAPVALQVDPARVLLHNPGTAPHRTLEYAAEWPEQQVTVAVTTGFRQQVMRADAVEVQAPEASQDAPDLPGAETITLPLRATGSAEDGTHRVETALGQPASSLSENNAELGTARGFTLGWQGDASGRISTVDLAAPAEASDTGRALTEKALMKLLSLPVIFPAEPVGVGAVWSVDSRVTGEATLLQTTTYTLTALDGDSVELSVSVQQRPAQGALVMSDAGAVGGSDSLETPATESAAGGDDTLDVMNANTSSTGTLRLSLNGALPREGTVALTTRVVYGQQESDVRVVQDTATRLRFH